MKTEIKNRIQNIRYIKNITRDELSYKTGITIRKLIQIEKNEIIVNLEDLNKIAKVLDCQIKYLFEGEGKI